MPQTDLTALASPETKKQFNDLFAFAMKEGALTENAALITRRGSSAIPSTRASRSIR